MSIRRLTDVWAHSPYSGNALLIHLALADFADEDGVCYPRKSTLADKARCTEETVRTTLLKMADDGEIAVLEEPGRGRYARAGRFQLTPKKSGDCGSIPKSDEPIPKSECSIPKSGESTPPIGTVIEPSVEPRDVEVVDDWEMFFNAFWEAYPRKVGKPAAKRAMKAKYDAVNQHFIAEGTRQWIFHWARSHTEEQFIPHPSTFLNQDRYNDRPPAAVAKRDTPEDIIARIAQRDSL